MTIKNFGYLVALLGVASVVFAQSRGMTGGGMSGQPVDGTTIKPKSVQVSGTGDQFVCTATTAVCEVESSINAATMTSTVPAFDIGPTATPGANDRLACFSYGASGSKTRVACVDVEGDMNATTLTLSAASAANAITLTEGARIVLDSANASTRYMRASSSQIDFVGYLVTAPSGFSAGNGQFQTYNQATATLNGVVNDGATAVATALRSNGTYSTAGAKITSFRNGTSEVAFVDYLGGFTSSVAANNWAFNCATVGCRMSFGNTARYLYDDNSATIRTNSFFRADSGLIAPLVDSGGALEVRGNSTTVGTIIRATNASARVADFQSGTEVVSDIDADGLPRFNKTNVAKPTCNAGNRGKFYFLDGAAGVADIVEVCGKNAADVYAWQALATF